MSLPRPPTNEAVYGDRFEVIEESGAGGMGTIFHARDRRTGGEVALKVLRDRRGPSTERFDQEAALLAELHHPAIVTYVAHGSTAAGERFLAMEWLAGETLEDRLLRGPLGVVATARMGRRILEALAVAHARGIVHRDLKPANLLLPGDDLDAVKLIDFGIARRMFDSRRITLVGSTLGTPMYMSPEQARGSGDIDARADLFSLGCVIFECLSGQPPFVGESPIAVLAKICLDDSLNVAERCPGLSPVFAKLLTQMLAKDPAHRPPSADELAGEFADLCNHLLADGHGDDEMVAMRSRTPAPVSEADEARVLCAVMVAFPRPSGGPLPGDSGAGLTLLNGTTGVSTEASGAVKLESLRRLLAPWGGRVDRLLDGSMVVTLVDRGIAAAVEQAARAARCALLLRQVLPGAAFALATGRSPHAGVLPIGDVLDTGARLLFGEPPGSICVDDLSSRFLSSRFQLAGGPKRHLLFEKGPHDPPRVLRGNSAPFMGRDRELGTLEALWDECVNERAARVALVTAPSGGGTSRLRQELVERMMADGNPFEYLHGQAESLVARMPLVLLGSALRTAAGLSGRERSEQARSLFEAHFSRCLAPARAPEVVAFLGEIAGVRFRDDEVPALEAARQDARLMADGLRLAWLEWLEAATGEGPVALVLEDVHAADRASLGLVDVALQVLSDRPLFVLALGRPESVAPVDEAWSNRDVLRLPLPPLTSKACQKMAIGTVAELGDERAAWLVERAHGLPWAIEEVLRGADVAQGESSPVPSDLVARRLGLRDERTQQILGALSVLGAGCSAGDVAGVLGLATHFEVAPALADLVADETLHSFRQGDEELFSFRQVLTAEVVYRGLREDERRGLHAAAGRICAGRGGADTARAAAHLSRAAAAGADAALVAVAERALYAGDAVTARLLAEAGLHSGPEEEIRARLRLCEAEAALAQGHPREAEVASREARDRGRGAVVLDAARVCAIAVAMQRRWDDFDQAVTVLADRHASGDDEVRALHRGWVELAAVLIQLGKPERADVWLDRVEVAGRSVTPLLAGRARALRAALAELAGDTVAAVASYETASRMLEAVGDARRAALVRMELGRIFAAMGMVDSAEQNLRRALLVMERLGGTDQIGPILLDLGNALLAMGRRFEARMFAERAMDQAVGRGDTEAQIGAAVLMGQVALGDDDPLRAENQARGAVETARSVGSPLQALALGVLARALLGQGRVPEAREIVGDANARMETRTRSGAPRSRPSSSTGLPIVTPGAALSLAGHQAACPGESLVRLVCAETFAASGEMALGRRVLERACARLEERAAALGKPEWRASFLQRLPDNARTVGLRSQWRLGA